MKSLARTISNNEKSSRNSYPSSLAIIHSDHMADLIRLGQENDIQVHAWKVMFKFSE